MTPAYCPAVSVCPDSISNRPVKLVLKAQPANLCDPSMLAPRSGILLRRGSDTAMRGQGATQDDAFQLRGNKMDDGGRRGSSMFLLVKESQIAFLFLRQVQ